MEIENWAERRRSETYHFETQSLTHNIVKRLHLETAVAKQLDSLYPTHKKSNGGLVSDQSTDRNT